MACQLIFVAQNNNAYCLCVHKPMKKDFKGKKDSKVKKTPNTSINYNSCSGGQASQSKQTTGQSTIKGSYLYQCIEQGQCFGILAIGINITIVKENKNKAKKT